LRGDRNSINSIKSQVVNLVGKRIVFKDKNARLWFHRPRKVFEGIVKEIYPHHFLVEIISRGKENYRECFAYTDLLIGQYKLLEDKFVKI